MKNEGKREKMNKHDRFVRRVREKGRNGDIERKRKK
jgi:hypothetical protein